MSLLKCYCVKKNNQYWSYKNCGYLNSDTVLNSETRNLLLRSCWQWVVLGLKRMQYEIYLPSVSEHHNIWNEQNEVHNTCHINKALSMINDLLFMFLFLFTVALYYNNPPSTNSGPKYHFAASVNRFSS